MLKHNPLHLLPDRDDWLNISATDLKKWRKELLLQFDLTGETTINIKGKTYDKDTILTAFADLERDSDYYIRLYRNKPLQAFLETGDLDFFEKKNTKSWQDIYDPVFVLRIKDVFSAQLSKQIYRHVTQKGDQHIAALRLMIGSRFYLPPPLEDAVYSKTYTHLQQFVQTCQVRYASPFETPNSQRLVPNITEDINGHYLKVFKLLPPLFSDIAERYALIARNILAQAIRKFGGLRQFNRFTLLFLQMTARIDWEIRKSPDMKVILEQLSTYLSLTDLQIPQQASKPPFQKRREYGHRKTAPAAREEAVNTQLPVKQVVIAILGIALLLYFLINYFKNS